MNHSKLILVGCISAFVAITTAVLGVTGTIIGSVLSSVLYNMLSEALEKPVQKAKFRTNFEWEIAYVFPLVVILLIQLLLILAFLSEWGLISHIFLNAYLTIQELANNNLYRVLGLSLIVMSIYPLVLKPDIIKKNHGLLISFIGVLFLIRGFSDTIGPASHIFFTYLDFPLALIAFLLLVFVIYKILMSAKEYEKEFNIYKNKTKSKPINHVQVKHRQRNVKSKHINRQKSINESANNIQFESNDLLEDYKK